MRYLFRGFSSAALRSELCVVNPLEEGLDLYLWLRCLPGSAFLLRDVDPEESHGTQF